MHEILIFIFTLVCQKSTLWEFTLLYKLKQSTSCKNMKHVFIPSLFTCFMLAFSKLSLLYKLVMFFFLFTWWGKCVWFFLRFCHDIVDGPKCRAACSAPIWVIVGKIFCTFWCQKLKEEFHTKRLTHCQKLAVSYKDRTQAVKLRERFPALSSWPANWALDCMPFIP